MESKRQSKARAAIQEFSESDPSNRLQLSHGKKVLKQLQDIQEADDDRNYQKSLKKDRIINTSFVKIYVSYKYHVHQCRSIYNNETVEAFRVC